MPMTASKPAALAAMGILSCTLVMVACAFVGCGSSTSSVGATGSGGSPKGTGVDSSADPGGAGGHDDGTSAGGMTGSAAGGTSGGGVGGVGGATGAGGAGVVSGLRTTLALDRGWLFKFGDAAGADAKAFSDATWRVVSLPHDWSIEGPNPPANPFSQTAASTGRGGYLPSGISWYRKHFVLPPGLDGHRVFIEFDGVMGNSDVYVNGTHIGKHPYGYVSFRYDITSSVTFGSTDNVLAVKTNTSSAASLPLLCGRGFYRRARLIVTDPVHLGQYATFVTTPAPTATAATVHVTTAVVNGGSAPASAPWKVLSAAPPGRRCRRSRRRLRASPREHPPASPSTCPCRVPSCGIP